MLRLVLLLLLCCLVSCCEDGRQDVRFRGFAKHRRTQLQVYQSCHCSYGTTRHQVVSQVLGHVPTVCLQLGHRDN